MGSVGRAPAEYGEQLAAWVLPVHNNRAGCGLAIIPVWGSEWACGVGCKHFCSQPPPAGLNMV
jgi:hypothetical protein